MKILPCQFVGTAKQRCKSKRLAPVAYRVATLRDGKPYTLLRWTLPVGSMTYRCEGCQRKSTITASQFRDLPTLSLEQLRELKLDGLVTKDLHGAGVTPDQLSQLEAAGLSVEELTR